MPRDTNQPIRSLIDTETYCAEAPLIKTLIQQANLTEDDRRAITSAAAQIVTQIRNSAKPGLMEVFLAEYGLSTDEGIALMCLAEALLRVPDAETIDALIEDKIAPSDWGKHMGHSTSPLVNASTWALMLTGSVLNDENSGVVGTLKAAVKRLGEPVIRTAVSRAMKEMGRQFVLGETITSAMKRASKMEEKGYTYSYDMLGEAARTDADATRYHLSYSRAITAIADACVHDDIRKNPGISIKLSALHPRYEIAQRERVMDELVPRLRSLALLAKSARMGLNIDAEEADRLSLSLDIIETVLAEPALKGWDGFGFVIQAYGKRASHAIDYLYDLSTRLDRKIMVRLVKGAYWDTEIKRAQVAGLSDFPVFTDKSATDVSYIANARKLLGMTDRIYPQFATHNAHTVAAILHMAPDSDAFEFQRLHGMGETLHDIVLHDKKTHCRIYAPVGAHRDLLAYLVRRLLENGANSSFVNQIVDTSVPPETVATDPFTAVGKAGRIQTGTDLFVPERSNSKGFDLFDLPTLTAIDDARAPFHTATWQAHPLTAAATEPKAPVAVINPANPSDTVGQVIWSSPADVTTAMEQATIWVAPAQARSAALNRAADLYEENFGELFALLTREAGKTPKDAVAELREGVDFLRYYATQASEVAPLGTVACISPWNFPLAIFTGQIAAALAAGNAVIAKPAEQTPLIATRLVQLLHSAGVPVAALQLLHGAGDVGAAITSHPKVAGVAFTGSTQTALHIRSSMAMHGPVGAPLIAETGGLNAMIVDSTALPEQAVAAIIESAFQSAGQRCSALRCLYVQTDIAEEFTKMLIGAMKELSIGDPWSYATDVGPVIDRDAQTDIAAHIDAMRAKGKVIFDMPTPNYGHFISPTLIKVDGIAELEREIFGPVLHICTFDADELDKIINDINATGYGLTFGLQTRIDDRVQTISDQIHSGNIYVNRNQIGAIVGSQPFGGEGLSGTGPKAGGPHYLGRFSAKPVGMETEIRASNPSGSLRQAIDTAPISKEQQAITLPGPTGESNVLKTMSRPPILCAGPSDTAAKTQAQMIRDFGGTAVIANWGFDAKELETLKNIGGVIWWGDEATGRDMALALSRRTGPIVPLITAYPDKAHACSERHICIDTTAAGGNASLLAGGK